MTSRRSRTGWPNKGDEQAYNRKAWNRSAAQRFEKKRYRRSDVEQNYFATQQAFPEWHHSIPAEQSIDREIVSLRRPWNSAEAWIFIRERPRQSRTQSSSKFPPSPSAFQLFPSIIKQCIGNEVKRLEVRGAIESSLISESGNSFFDEV